jgi:DNA repair exonuclease SbcCD ATPase subunit
MPTYYIRANLGGLSLINNIDAENLEGFVRILELIKSYFKTVILISHLDSLKDCVDSQIVIDRKDGYAYIYQ